MKKLVRGDTDIALGRWDVLPAEVAARVVLPDALAVAVPDTHPLAASTTVHIGQLADDAFVSLSPHEGAVLPDRLRRLAHDAGFVANVVQIAPDTQTALALVSAEVGCHLTLASVARNVTDPHVVFVPLDAPAQEVDLLAAWRRDDRGPALRAVLDELLALDGVPRGGG
jgi:DNA-binding transcriptional LysR family regulator